MALADLWIEPTKAHHARMISKLRDARNSALITHASGPQIDELGERAGLPRPYFVSRGAWRRTVHAANAYRGLPNCTQFVLEGMLHDWHTRLNVVLDPSRPTQLVSPGAEFTQALVGRTVRIPEYGLFRVVGPYNVNTAPFRNEILDLCTIETPSWSVPNWETLEAPTALEAEFHAFLVREDQAGPRMQTLGDESGTVTIYVYPEVVAEAPPTFLQELPDGLADPGEVDDEAEYPELLDAQPADDWPEGVPSGGWLVDSNDDDGIIGDAPDGPWPAFIATDEVLLGLRESMRAVLSTGFKARFVPFPQQIASEVGGGGGEEEAPP